MPDASLVATLELPNNLSRAMRMPDQRDATRRFDSVRAGPHRPARRPKTRAAAGAVRR